MVYLQNPIRQGNRWCFQLFLVVENFQLLPFLLRHVVRHISASPIEFHPRLAPGGLIVTQTGLAASGSS